MGQTPGTISRRHEESRGTEKIEWLNGAMQSPCSSLVVVLPSTETLKGSHVGAGKGPQAHNSNVTMSLDLCAFYVGTGVWIQEMRFDAHLFRKLDRWREEVLVTDLGLDPTSVSSWLCDLGISKLSLSVFVCKKGIVVLVLLSPCEDKNVTFVTCLSTMLLTFSLGLP